jgi:hypothetical protein
MFWRDKMKRGVTILALLGALGLGTLGLGSCGASSAGKLNNNKPAASKKIRLDLCKGWYRDDVRMIGACSSGEPDYDYIEGDWVYSTEDATTNPSVEFFGVAGPDYVFTLKDLVAESIDSTDVVATVGATQIDDLTGQELCYTEQNLALGDATDLASYGEPGYSMPQGLVSVNLVGYETTAATEMSVSTETYNLEGVRTDDPEAEDACSQVIKYRGIDCVTIELEDISNADATPIPE